MKIIEKISHSKILVIGLRGSDIEKAKDIIVSGPNKVTIIETNKVILEDLSNNFYLSEKDIGKRRDEECLEKYKK
jgi:ubiquitin-activating enzyme E1